MSSEKDRIRNAYRQLRFLFYLAMLLIAIFAGLYFFNFGVSTKFHNDRGVWGQFGDYLGGILNPVIALFALWGIIQTIRLQGEDLKISADALAESSKSLAEQVKHLTEEKVLIDLRQAIEHTENEIDAFLDQQVVAIDGKVTSTRLREVIENSPTSLINKHSLLDRATAKTRYDKGEIQNTSDEWRRVEDAIQLAIRFDRLSRLLSQYETIAKHNYFVSSVKSKYNTIISKLFEKHYLNDIGPYMLQVGDLPEVVSDPSEPMKIYKIN